MSGSDTYTLGYDAGFRLLAVNKNGAGLATFAYDGDGNRVKATVGSATSAYVGNYFEWSGSTSTMMKYYYAGGTRIAMRTGAGTGTTGLLWVFGDHPSLRSGQALGSSSRIANADGTPCSETRYKPWGETRYGSGALSTDMIFKDGFESGSFSAWSSSTTDGGDLSVTTSAALKGTKGMQVVVDDANLIYATDDTPNAEPRYRARFYFDPNSITFGSLGFAMIAGYSGTTPVLRVDLFYSSGSYKVRARILKDDGTWLYGSYINITDAPHYLELDWKAATAPGANNGSVAFWVDGVSASGVSGVDNDTHRIDRVRLGEPEGGGAGIAGTIYIDAFESRKGTYIGAEAPTDFLFTGQRLEEEIGLYYYGARWYDPYLARFAQPDSMVPGVGNPLSWDRYAYVNNNPTRYIDPSGHMLTDGCSYEGCSLTQKDIDDNARNEALWLAKNNELNCQAGNKGYCSGNPAEIAAFTVTTLVTLGIAPDLPTIFHAIGYEALAACSQSPICWGLIGAGSADALNKSSNPTIGKAGVTRVLDILNDPSARTEVSVYVDEAGKRANIFARLDILTQTAIHEVKNVGELSLSQKFMEQAYRYKLIADSAGLDLHYWLMNDAPANVQSWLENIGITVHIP